MASPILRLFDSGGTEVTSTISLGQATPGVPTTEQTFTVRNNDGGATAVDTAPGAWILGTSRVAGSSDPYVSLGNTFADAGALQGRVTGFSGGATGQLTGFKKFPLRLGTIPDGGQVSIGVRVVNTAAAATSDWQVTFSLQNSPQLPLRDMLYEGLGNFVYTGLAGGLGPDPYFYATRTVTGALAPQGTPSATVDLPTQVRYVLAGVDLTWEPSPATLTFTDVDGDAVSLTSGNYYWAGLTLDNSASLTVTKGSQAALPTSDATKPTLPAGENFRGWVVVPFGLAIDTVETGEAPAFFALAELGGLDISIAAGQGASAGWWTHPTIATEITLPDDQDSTVWALPFSSFAVTVTGSLPTAEPAALKLHRIVTASGAIASREDLRVFGPSPPTPTGSVLTVSQTAHGFAVGDWLMLDEATPEWELLDISDRTGTLEPGRITMCGFVEAVYGDDSFGLTVLGVATYTHGLGTGTLYATSTGGTVTTAQPSLGTVSWPVGVATAADKITIIQRGWTQL